MASAPSPPSRPNVAQDAQTVTEVVRTLEARGYTGQLRAVEGGAVQCLTCRETMVAGAIAAERISRHEGVSDPSEMLAIVALRCPHCDTPGVLILNYGPDAPPEDSDVLLAMDDARPTRAAPPPDQPRAGEPPPSG